MISRKCKRMTKEEIESKRASKKVKTISLEEIESRKAFAAEMEKYDNATDKEKRIMNFEASEKLEKINKASSFRQRGSSMR